MAGTVKGKITKIESIGDYFVGNGDIVMFDALDLLLGKVPDLTGAMSLGDIKTGTSKWSGTAPALTAFKNEQGETVYNLPVNGDYGFEFQVMSTSAIMQAALLGGVDLTDASTFTLGDVVGVGSKVSGFGTVLPAVECPIGVINLDKSKMFLFPNATIISQIVDDGGNAAIKCIVTANKVDTLTLKTVMFIDGAPNYTVDPA